MRKYMCGDTVYVDADADDVVYVDADTVVYVDADE